MGNVRFLHVAVLLKIGGEFFVLWVKKKGCFLAENKLNS